MYNTIRAFTKKNCICLFNDIFAKQRICSQHGEFFQVFFVYVNFLYILFNKTSSAATQIQSWRVEIIFLLKENFCIFYVPETHIMYFIRRCWFLKCSEEELSRQHIPVLRIWDVYPESRIPDPGSDFFPSWIPDPTCLHSGSRIRTKEFKYFNPKKTKKMVSKLAKIWFELFIPDPGSGCWLSTHPGSRILDPGVKKAPDPGSLPTTPHPLNTSSHKTAARRPPHSSYTQQHTTTLHNSTRVHKTTNVPVVFMARYVMILRGATSLWGALEGVGPENRYFFGPWNGTSEVLNSTLIYLTPHRFHSVGGCWDRTQDCCNFGIGSRTLQPLCWISSTEKEQRKRCPLAPMW